VTGQEDIVGQHDLVAHHAVVRHMGSRHEKAVRATTVSPPATVDRLIVTFSRKTVCGPTRARDRSPDQPQVLGIAPDDRARMNHHASAQSGERVRWRGRGPRSPPQLGTCLDDGRG